METWFNGKKQSEAWINGKKAKEVWKNGKKVFDGSIKTTLKLPLLTDLTDLSELSNTISTVGTLTFSDGAVFNGSNCITVNPKNVNIRANDLTFGCEVMFNTLSGIFGIIGQSVANGASIHNGRYAFYVDAGQLCLMFQNPTTAVTTISVNTNTLTIGVYYKIVGIINRTSGVLTLLINGSVVATGTISTYTSDINLTTPFYIGAYGNINGLSPQWFFNGKIKKAFVTRQALTSQQCSDIFNEF